MAKELNIKRDILWRVFFAFACISIFAVVVMVYAIRIQVVEGEKWRNMADSLSKVKSIEAARGNIYDCNGNLLATSVPIFEVRLDLLADGISNKLFKEKIDSLSFMLSGFFKDKSRSEYKRILTKARKDEQRYFLLKDKLSYNQIKVLKTFPIFRMGRYKGGFMVEQENMRLMPFNQLARRTIGYKNKDNVRVGLEGSFDKELTGTNGSRLMRKISGGTWMPLNDENEIEPENGKDIISTLDVNLQDVAEDALMRSLEKNKADHGCAILIETTTGEIKALANLKRISEGVCQEVFNYAIGDNTEPGSTFKLVSMLALLEDGLAELTDSTSTEGGQKRFADRMMYDSEEGGYGIVSLEEAFEKSSNVAISKFIHNAYSSNPQKFVDHINRLGLNKKLGMQIAGEANPIIKQTTDRKNWYGTTLPWMSVGYEVNVTPMQIATLYNAVANNGKMIKPLLVKEIRSSGKPVQVIETEVLNEKICSDATLEKLKQALKNVVEKGTAKNLRNLNYTVAGKTGTAQVADANRGYSQKVYQSSFVGFFPAEKPMYTCLVVINNPTAGVYYGSLVAGPVFKEIADKVYSLNIAMQPAYTVSEVTPTLPSIKSGSLYDYKLLLSELGISYAFEDADETSDWVDSKKDDGAIKLKEVKVYDSKVPRVTGMGLRDAIYILENAGLHVSVIGAGSVAEQWPQAGTYFEKGDKVNLILR